MKSHQKSGNVFAGAFHPFCRCFPPKVVILKSGLVWRRRRPFLRRCSLPLASFLHPVRWRAVLISQRLHLRTCFQLSADLLELLLHFQLRNAIGRREQGACVVRSPRAMARHCECDWGTGLLAQRWTTSIAQYRCQRCSGAHDHDRPALRRLYTPFPRPSSARCLVLGPAVRAIPPVAACSSARDRSFRAQAAICRDLP